MARYEFRSMLVTVDQYGYEEAKGDKLQQLCNKWAAEGFVVFSIICPDPRNYSTYRLTACRDNESSFTPTMFQEML